MMSPYRYTFSDLTIGEIQMLIKDFFFTSFICLLVFGIPYALFVAFSWGVTSVVSGGRFSWLPQALAFGLLGYVVVFLIRNLPYTLKFFGDGFMGLSTAAANVSRVKQSIGLAFVIGYFYSAYKFPLVWFWFTILIFTPAVFTHDRYTAILKRKTESHIGQDTPRGEDGQRLLD